MAGAEFSNSPLVEIAREAGEIGMSFFQKADTQVWYKSGNSPVSEADEAIDKFLRESLLGRWQDHGWLSEETEDNADRLKMDRLFVVDPIDGTRGFVNGDPRWCISIAIIEAGQPVEGVLHCPALGETFHAKKARGFQLTGGGTGNHGGSGRPRVTGSKKLIEVMRALDGEPFDVLDFIPSLAYRLGLVASGVLDGAFARQGAHEWDIAAADIILREAGCQLTDKHGKPILYNSKNPAVSALVAAPTTRSSEILALANSHGILH